jgi:hypothetical protein
MREGAGPFPAHSGEGLPQVGAIPPRLSGRRSRTARVGASPVDPIDDRLNLRIGKIWHPRRFGVGGHSSELTIILVEQRPPPLQRHHQVGVRAVTDDKDPMGRIWSGVDSGHVPSGKLNVVEFVPEILVRCVGNAVHQLVLPENAVDVGAERQSAAVERVDHSTARLRQRRCRRQSGHQADCSRNARLASGSLCGRPTLRLLRPSRFRIPRMRPWRSRPPLEKRAPRSPHRACANPANGHGLRSTVALGIGPNSQRVKSWGRATEKGQTHVRGTDRGNGKHDQYQAGKKG